jgi:hypothetical protein
MPSKWLGLFILIMKRPRYFIEHALVSLAIFLVVGLVFGVNSGYCSGVAFYAGREK